MKHVPQSLIRNVLRYIELVKMPLTVMKEIEVEELNGIEEYFDKIEVKE